MSKVKMEVAPSDLYLSIRGIQYAFHEAIADLADNSIDAGATSIWINVSKENIIIADDGDGMSLAELAVAITPWRAGKKDQKLRRGKRGKFGIGLKSASYSLGDSLSIHTKKKGNAFEHIILDKDEISEIEDPDHEFGTANVETSLFKSYCKDGHGTVLEIKKVNARKVTDQAVESLRNLLGLVYFHLLESGDLSIMINNQSVRGLDPLMRGLKKNSSKNRYTLFDKQTIHVEHHGRKATFKIQGAYVGKGNFWTDEDKKSYKYFLKRNPSEDDQLKKGLLKLDEQGLYTLRNGRLITLGGWYGLASSNTLLHHNSPCRVLLEFDESGDEMMGLETTKTQLKVDESLKEKLGTYIRSIVNEAEKLSRREGQEIKLLKERADASKSIKNLNLRKDSAMTQFQMEERRKKANPDFDKKQKDLEKEQEDKAKESDLQIELKEKLPYNNLWDFKTNKEGEVLLLLNEQHPGYSALFLEDDETKLRNNLNHFFFTLASHEAAINELHKELKPSVVEEIEKAFKTFRRWVSKHYTEF